MNTNDHGSKADHLSAEDRSQKQLGGEPRGRKLIKPRLQLRLIGVFVATASIALLLQSLLFTSMMMDTAAKIPMASGFLIDVLPSVLGRSLLFSFGLLLPLTVALGILATFRIAGPVYSLERHLRRIARGEEVGECRIRKGDELQELCDAINLAVSALRAGSASEEKSSSREDSGEESQAA